MAIQKRLKEERPDLQFLDQWLLPAEGCGLAGLADAIRREVLSSEQRQRARKPIDARNFERLADCLIANLANAVLEPPPEGGWLAYNDKHGRRLASVYRCSAFGDQLKPLLEALEGLGHIERREGLIARGNLRGQAPSIRPTDRLKAEVNALPSSEIRFRRGDDEYLVSVSASYWHQGDKPWEREKTKKRVEFKPTAEILALSDRVRQINAFIHSNRVELLDSDRLVLKDPSESSMVLKRYFFVPRGADPEVQGTWLKSGGRLFGGFWETMRKADRQRLRINGERVCEVDFRSMNAHIAYALAGAEPPTGDLYAIPGLEGYRADVKMLFNAMLSKDAGQDSTRWPKSMREEEKKLEASDISAADKPAGAIISSKIRPPKAMSMITEHHAGIADMFAAGRIGEIQFLESETLIAALEALRSFNIPALPIHDALLVPASGAEKAIECMEGAALNVIGRTVPVSCKAL